MSDRKEPESRQARVKRLARDILGIETIANPENDWDIDFPYLDTLTTGVSRSDMPIEDFIEQENMFENFRKESLKNSPSSEFSKKRVLQNLDSSPLKVQTIAAQTEMEIETVERVLSELLTIVYQMEEGVDPGRKLSEPLSLLHKIESTDQKYLKKLDKTSHPEMAIGTEALKEFQNRVLNARISDEVERIRRKEPKAANLSDKEIFGDNPIIQNLIISAAIEFDETSEKIIQDPEFAAIKLAAQNKDSYLHSKSENTALNKLIELIEEFHKERGIDQGRDGGGR